MQWLFFLLSSVEGVIYGTQLSKVTIFTSAFNLIQMLNDGQRVLINIILLNSVIKEVDIISMVFQQEGVIGKLTILQYSQ